MPWKHDGKIAMQFNWGAVNYDAVKIVYADNSHPYTADGDETNAINKVYYFPDGFDPANLNSSNLDDYLFWHRYWEEQPIVRQLANDTDGGYLLMKYETMSDVTVSSTSVFTTVNNDNGRRVYILDDNGILYAKSDATETKVADTTIHGLTAIKRTTIFSPAVTLKAEHTYWIQYYFEGMQNNPDAYYTEAGVTGTDYKKIALNNYSNYSPFTGDYILSDKTVEYDLTAEILALSAGEILKTKIGVYNPYNIGNAGTWIIRNSGNDAYNKTYKGIYVNTNSSDPNKTILDDVPNDNLFIVRKTAGSAPNTDFRVYLRKSGTIPDISYWDGSQGIQTAASLVNILINTCGDTNVNTDKGFKTNQYWNYGTNGDIIEWGVLYCNKNQCSVSMLTDTPLSQKPNRFIPGGLYFKNTNDAWGDESTNTPEIMIYLGDSAGNNQSWKRLQLNTTYTDINNNTYMAMEKVTIPDLYEDITNYCNLSQNKIIGTPSNVPTQIDISSTTYNDKRHYLEINGNEVF